MHTNTLSTEVSRNFWKNQDYYPQYGDVIKKRRLHETKFLTDWIWKNKITSLSDIGCGNGSSVTMLQELTDIEKFHCYDISEGMLNKIDTRSVRQAIIETHQIDLCNIEQDFLPTDLTTVLGVNMYLTDDQVISLMSKIQSKTVILRDPTSETREEINKYSKDLGSEYSAVYRTVDEYIELYSKAGYHITSAFRAYPDEIESKFGTMQFFFTCEKK